jgi:hypothetical protein
MFSFLAYINPIDDQPLGGGHAAVCGQVPAPQLQEHHRPAGGQVQHEQAQDLASELERQPPAQGIPEMNTGSSLIPVAKSLIFLLYFCHVFNIFLYLKLINQDAKLSCLFVFDGDQFSCFLMILSSPVSCTTGMYSSFC